MTDKERYAKKFEIKIDGKQYNSYTWFDDAHIEIHQLRATYGEKNCRMYDLRTGEERAKPAGERGW